MIFGDPDTFAIECELRVPIDGWVLAHFRFWVEGTPIGNFGDAMDLRGGVGWLRAFLAHSAYRYEPWFDSASAEAVFAELYTIYFRHAIVPCDRRARFHLDSVGMSAFEDRVGIVLYEHADRSQHLVWRTWKTEELGIADLPPGTFENVAETFFALVEPHL